MHRRGFGGRVDACDRRRARVGSDEFFYRATPERGSVPWRRARRGRLSDSVETVDVPEDAESEDERTRATLDRALRVSAWERVDACVMDPADDDALARVTLGGGWGGDGRAVETPTRAGAAFGSEFTRSARRLGRDGAECAKFERKRKCAIRREAVAMTGAFEGTYSREIERLHAEAHRFPMRRRSRDGGGIPNEGNSCYMSASLQLLKSLKDFVADVTLIDEWDVEKPVLASLSRFFQSDENCLRAADVKHEMSRIRDEYGEFDQQDAMEFITVMLETIEREMGEGAVDRCPSRKNFLWRIEHEMTCASCGARATVDESMYALTLQVVPDERQPVSALLERYFAIEMLERKCDECDGTTCYSMRRVIEEPKVLLLHLKRFSASYDIEREEMQLHKVAASIRLPSNLTLPHKFSEATKSPESAKSPESDAEDAQRDGGATSLASAPPPLPHSVETPDSKANIASASSSFDLSAVISHFGLSLETGHYVTHRRLGRSNHWKTFDDERVSGYVSRSVSSDEDSALLVAPQEFERECYVVAYERTH